MISLFQIQNITSKSIGYANKKVPTAAVNYLIKDLELFCLCINISPLKHLLVKVDFDCTVNHSSFTYIMKRKTETARSKTKRLIEVLSDYSFNLYYLK